MFYRGGVIIYAALLPWQKVGIANIAQISTIVCNCEPLVGH